eukprot:scaffold13705_cov44-Attheya_sp.AAC.1
MVGRMGHRGNVVAMGMAAVLVASLCGVGVQGQDLFAALDGNGDNVVSQKEFREAVQYLAQKPASNGAEAASVPGGTGRMHSGLPFWPAFTSSVMMILATEIGDKTFFIAAVMSMRNPRSAVFLGAIGALIVMTILSAMMGLVLPSILPRQYTHIIGGLLFCYFGIKLVYDARQLEANKVSDELEEVEEELTGKKNKKHEDGDSDDDSEDVENGEGSEGSGAANGATTGYKRSQSGFGQASGFRGQSFGKVVGQSFLMSFLAEWGDRSQIATIALAAAKDPLGVVVGGCLGHSMCTGMAVIGGRMLASKISERTVSLFGGIIFCIFGIHSLFFET